MRNLIKMDVYRMFHTKSLYIIWIILGAMIVFSTFMTKLDYEALQEPQQETTQEVTEETEASEQINVGMKVELPTKPGEKLTVFDEMYSNIQGKFVALFLVIFAVIYATADLTSGYIKNISGMIPRREYMVFSKAVALGIYTFLSFLYYMLVQAIAVYGFFGYLRWGKVEPMFTYLAVQFVLHYAFLLICMGIAIVLRNNTFSMAISVCLTMNFAAILYGLLDKLIAKMGIKDFQTITHTVTGKIAVLSMHPAKKECLASLLIAVLFGGVATAVTGYVFKTRDI